MEKILIFVGALLFPLTLSPVSKHEMIIWNVGQGQWTTWIKAKSCHHFDMGGETMNWLLLKKLCDQKINVAYFSHSDWDHIGLAGKARHYGIPLCIALMPNGPTSKAKKKFLSRFPLCPHQHNKQALELPIKTDPHSQKPNDYSRVFVVLKRFLIPGDSPKKQEAQWIRSLRSPIEYLMVGHHGSYTSTSQKLLGHLPYLKMAFISARKKRYGHPHKKTMDSLRKAKVPAIRTEFWGTIRIPL